MAACVPLRSMCVLAIAGCFFLPSRISAQDPEQATRQFAVAVGFQNQKLFEPAIEEWQTFLKRFPDDPRADKARHYLGTCQLQAKQFSAAATTLNQLAERSPGFEMLDQTLLNLGSSWLNLAEASKKPDEYRAAEHAFAKLLKNHPESEYVGRARYFLGECHYQQGRLPDAARSWEEFTKRFPKDELIPEALYALGICQEELKLPQKAESTFADFQTKFPNHPLTSEVRMRQAEALFSDQQFAKAAPLFARISQDRSSALADTAMLRHARCLYELKQYEEAATAYWNVPREFPQTKHYDAAVLAGAKCLILIEKYARARAGLEKVAARKVPEAAEASEWIARSYLKEGNPQAALEGLSEAIRRHAESPALPQLLLTRADALYEIPEQRGDARKQYADLAAKYAQHELAPQALYMAALSNLKAGDHQEASVAAASFLKQYASNPLAADVRFIAAEASLLVKNYPEALSLYDAFLKSAPQHASAQQARVRRCLALHLAGKDADAIRDAQPLVGRLKDPALIAETYAILGRAHQKTGHFSEAAAALEKSLATGAPKSSIESIRMLLADTYQKLDRIADAESEWKKLATEFPKSAAGEEATFRLAEAAYARGEYAAAVEHYARVITQWPQGRLSAESLFGLGWAHFKMNAFQKSVDALASLKSRFPESPLSAKATYLKAMSEFQQGELETALKDARSFLAMKPEPKDAADAEYLLGLILAGQKQFDEAAKAFAGLLKSNPDYADADKVLYELGWAWSELGQTQKAMESFQQLADKHPQSPLAAECQFRVAEMLYEAGRYDDAVRVYQKIRAKEGEAELAEKAAHKLAWCHLKSERFSEAQQAFAEQLKTYPRGALAGDAEFLIAECFYREKKWNEALKHYARVIESKHPTYEALALFRSGECAAAVENWPLSQQFHQRVLDSFPEFDLRPEARYGVAWSLQNQNQLPAAITLYEKVTEETDTETAAKARFMIGECCFAQKKHAEAAKHFLKAAFAYNHREWSALAWFEAARCFEVLRDLDQAKNCYRQMIEKFPEHSKVADARKRLNELGGSPDKGRRPLTN